MILTFAWTTDALLSGKKTCTRRQWSDRTAQSWISACQKGNWIHQAWDNIPRVKGAKRVGDIRLTQIPYQERLADMPHSDVEAEGGLWRDKEEFVALFGRSDLVVWVVRFELTKIPEYEVHP